MTCSFLKSTNPSHLSMNNLFDGDPSQKDYTISDNSNIKIETLMQEIEKCIVLCANCHREFHYFERTNNLTIQEYLNGGME